MVLKMLYVEQQAFTNLAIQENLSQYTVSRSEVYRSRTREHTTVNKHKVPMEVALIVESWVVHVPARPFESVGNGWGTSAAAVATAEHVNAATLRGMD